jgi:hypothetical protein
MAWKDPEKAKEYNKEYRKKNKEKVKEYDKTEKRIKSRTIAKWKNRGVKCDDFDKLYELYLNCKHCQVCKKEFKDSYDRCMDHCHETGLFRAFLCRSCNVMDNWKNKV